MMAQTDRARTLRRAAGVQGGHVFPGLRSRPPPHGRDTPPRGDECVASPALEATARRGRRRRGPPARRLDRVDRPAGAWTTCCCVSTRVAERRHRARRLELVSRPAIDIAREAVVDPRLRGYVGSGRARAAPRTVAVPHGVAAPFLRPSAGRRCVFNRILPRSTPVLPGVRRVRRRSDAVRGVGTSSGRLDLTAPTALNRHRRSCVAAHLGGCRRRGHAPVRRTGSERTRGRTRLRGACSRFDDRLRRGRHKERWRLPPSCRRLVGRTG